jgi:hypothetical protein
VGDREDDQGEGEPEDSETYPPSRDNEGKEHKGVSMNMHILLSKDTFSFFAFVDISGR